MKILVIGNLSDRRCGFQNFSVQTSTALLRAGHDVTAWDGTYPVLHAAQEHGQDGFFPADVESYDLVHIIWHALTMNHYAGATWSRCRRVSIWDGGPSDASCPFIGATHIRWSTYQRDGYHLLWYPIPDWVDNLPTPDPLFTVGCSSVRGDGVHQIKEHCAHRGWGFNGPSPDQWLPLEEEVRRLALSTINVSWYRTNAVWRDQAGAPSMMLASERPLLVNRDSLLAHLYQRPDIYWEPDDLEGALDQIAEDARQGRLLLPKQTLEELSWTAATRVFEEGWETLR